MNTNNWEARINPSSYKVTYDLWLFSRRLNGVDLWQGKEIVFVSEGDSSTPVELYPEQLQALADELGKQGFHPRKEFVEGKLEATEKHLSDMRKLLKLK